MYRTLWQDLNTDMIGIRFVYIDKALRFFDDRTLSIGKGNVFTCTYKGKVWTGKRKKRSRLHYTFSYIFLTLHITYDDIKLSNYSINRIFTLEKHVRSYDALILVKLVFFNQSE